MKTHVDVVGLWLLGSLALVGGIAWLAQWMQVRAMRKRVERGIKAWGRG